MYIDLNVIFCLEVKNLHKICLKVKKITYLHSQEATVFPSCNEKINSYY